MGKSDVLETNKDEIIAQAKKDLQTFFEMEEDAILTFTREKRLLLEIKEEGEQFGFDAPNYTLFVPLKPFLEEEIDPQMVLFAVYEVLALFSNWKKYPEEYLNRMNFYRMEIEHLVLVLRRKLKMERCDQLEEYTDERLYQDASAMIGVVLLMSDHLYRYLRVLALCPIYRKENYQKQIQEFYYKSHFSWDYLENERLHEKIMDGLVLQVIFGMDGCKDYWVKQFLEQPIFETTLKDFMVASFKKMIKKDASLVERDQWIQAFLMPGIMHILEEEIHAMDINPGSSKQQGDGESGSYNKNSSLKQGMNQQDEEDLLQQLADEKKGNQNASEDIRKGKIDLERYHVSENDQLLFQQVVAKISPQREAMKSFWMKLIGEAKKEEPFKKNNEVKGKLNVNSIVENYPDFIEDMHRGNYRDLKIFDRYYLKPEARRLPKQIDISFVIDNSGSMEDEKIDIQRQALALSLLSLQDFDEYLKYNATILKQRIEVRTEVFYFGTGHTILKNFEDRKDPAQELASTVQSIVRLDGKQGSTDDGGCLKAIYRRLSSEDQIEILRGKRLHLVFEITDGASSFPQITKEALAELQDAGVYVFAFKIGKEDEQEEKIFKEIFMEDGKTPVGMMVYDQLSNLPILLIQSAAKQLKKVFDRS